MAACKHHWILRQPKDAFIHGRCKKCDRERIFPAQLDGTDRGNDYLELASNGSGGRSGVGVGVDVGARAA